MAIAPANRVIYEVKRGIGKYLYLVHVKLHRKESIEDINLNVLSMHLIDSNNRAVVVCSQANTTFDSVSKQLDVQTSNLVLCPSVGL